MVTVRLHRKPSLWSSFCVCAVTGFVWTGFFFVASWLAWERRWKMPTFAFVLLVIFDLISIIVLWQVVARFRRTLRDREPTVDIDRDAMSYGESANLYLVESHPEDIDELAVKLVGECWAKAMTDVSEYRRTIVEYSRCYEEELLRFSPDPDRPLSRKVKMQLPKCAPADAVRWKIVVGARLKHGSVIEHPFPLRVRESIP